jgi:hypothetical protein
MAPKPLSPIEALAKRQVKPITPVKTGVVKQAAPPPINPFLPSTTVPSTGAASNVPENKPFVGPTLDPDVIQERSKLKSQEIKALQAGIDPAIVKSIVAGQGDPNRGFLGPARAIGRGIKGIGGAIVPDVVPFTQIDISDKLSPVGKGAANVALKGLSAASPALNKLDLGRRLVVSTFKEIGDELAAVRGTRGRGVSINPKTGKPYAMGAGGFNVKDWWSQLSDETNITGGDIYGGLENPYANQLAGFVTDVFTDPLTAVSGPAGIGKTAVVRGTITGATKTGSKIATSAAKAELKQFAAAAARKLAEEKLDDAIRIGDNAAAAIQEDAIALADKLAADAAKTLSSNAAGRTYGRTSNQALAGKVLELRDEAQKVVEIGTANADELAFAQRTVDVLNDGVIKNIQTSGLAGIAGPYLDILRGVRTPAQDVLGVRGGLRIVNPLSVFGQAPLRAVIPGTERITNVAGKLIADSRLGLFKGPLGPLTTKVLNNITPTGEGGILGSADLLELRTGLRRGGLSPREATQATRLLELDQKYRALVNNERKVAAGALSESGLGDAAKFDKETLNEVIRLRQTPTLAGTSVALNPTQQAASDAIDKIFDYFYDYSAKASGGTGYIPPRRADYFPQMQSDKAIRWAQKFPKKAEELAKQLKVDRTWFVGNFRARELKDKDIWFGHELEPKDINATQLNYFARNPKAGSGIPGLDFDYFETDVLTVIGKYAQKHAQFAALQKTIGSLPETIPSMSARVSGTKFQTPKPIPEGTKISAPGFGLEDAATGYRFDERVILEQLSEGELSSLLDEIKTISSKVTAKSVDKKEIETLTSLLDARIAKIEDDFVNGAITPLTAAVASDEVKKLSQTIFDELQRVELNLNTVPKTRWTEYADIVKKGFQELNPDYFDADGNLIRGTAPNIAVTDELAELLRNAERVKDPEFAARARQIALDYTRFSKAWLTARPGFHTRNALSNTYQLIAAGADPRNLIRGNKILNKINEGLKTGLTPREVAERLVNSRFIKAIDIDPFMNPRLADPKVNRVALIEAIEDAINYSGATGFGQYGEIAAEVGSGNRGLFLKGGPRNKVDRAIGYIPQGSRWLGEKIENYSRFGLMWDGISKGLSPQEAAARANKYLIDYSDLSNVDRVAKQIIPFWTFMSRNTPLQLELMWTNPRAYAFYSNLKRNIEGPSEEEGGPVIPGYEKDRGVFPLETPINIPGMPESVKNAGRFAGAVPGVGPALGLLSQFPGLQGDVIRPGLPFPGGGENVLKGLIDNPKGFLASTNPLFRVPLEAAFGVKLFTGAPIAPKGEKTTQTKSRLIYLGRELFSTSSPLVAVLKSIEPARQNKFIQEYFGITEDDAEPVVQTVNSVLSFLGLPLGTQRTQSSVNELKSRFYDLEAYIKDAQDKAKIKQEERIEDAKKNPVAPGVNPFLPSTTTP